MKSIFLGIQAVHLAKTTVGPPPLYDLRHRGTLGYSGTGLK
jgi:hypothetical protein